MWVSGTRFEGTCSSKILCMDWKESTDGRGGWLATGCSEGTVGVSWISNPEWSGQQQPTETDSGAASGDSHPAGNIACTEAACYYKSHFILKGHLGEVRIVRWRPTGDRLASYDSWGRVIIWMNRANILAYEFQITTPLIVSDFQWSPCSFYSLLCGREGQVQLFSGVNGMNFFSVQIESTSEPNTRAEFTCCAWNSPATRAALGTENGEIIIIDPEEGGNSVTTVTLGKKGTAVQSLQWYGPTIIIRKTNGEKYKSQGLSVYLRNGEVILFKSITCPECVRSKTGVTNGKAAWNSDQTLWAIVGYKKKSSPGSTPIARFVNREGYILFTLTEGLPLVPLTQSSLKNVTWALNNSTVLMTWGCHLYSMELHSSLPSLQSLCRQVVVETLLGGEEGAVQQLPLPKREIERLAVLRTPLLPVPFKTCCPSIIDHLFQPLSGEQRLHCIMETTDSGFVLKYEYLNHYRALLNARKIKKGGFMCGAYQIEPAFDCSHIEHPSSDGSDKSVSRNWASSLVEDGESITRSSPSSSSPPTPPRRHILQQLKTVFKPGHSQGVMDIATTQDKVDVIPHKEPERLILAEVEGNSIVNRFRFTTTHHLFQDGYLGSLNISTNYVKCKPRKLTVHLSGSSSSSSQQQSSESKEVVVDGFEELSLRSKDPDWNSRYQIYELDFGGRVSRDSIKNFQIERGGQVVMQFGKSDSKRFCLDFQAPFSPVQALCVALTCVL